MVYLNEVWIFQKYYQKPYANHNNIFIIELNNELKYAYFPHFKVKYLVSFILF